MGLEGTPQRVAVYEAMKSWDMPLLIWCNQQASMALNTLTVATVYNVLESFVQAGLLQRRMSSNNKMYLDVNTYNHCHLYCEKTHSYKDYDDRSLCF